MPNINVHIVNNRKLEVGAVLMGQQAISVEH